MNIPQSISTRWLVIISALGIILILLYYLISGAFSIYFYADDFHEIGMAASVSPAIYKLFAMHYFLWYRPLAYFLQGLVYILAGATPWAYHLATLSLVILAAFGVYHLVRALGGNYLGALIAAALTLAHHGGASLMMMPSMGSEGAGGAMGLVWSLVCYLAARKRGSWGSIWLIIWMVIGAGFKEVWLLIPPFCLLAELILRPSIRGMLKRQLTVWLTFVAIIIIRWPMQTPLDLLTQFLAYREMSFSLQNLCVGAVVSFLPWQQLLDIHFSYLYLLAPLITLVILLLLPIDRRSGILIAFYFILSLVFSGVASFGGITYAYQRQLAIVVMATPIWGLILGHMIGQKKLLTQLAAAALTTALLTFSLFSNYWIISVGIKEGKSSQKYVASLKQVLDQLPPATRIFNYDLDYESMCLLFPSRAEDIVQVKYSNKDVRGYDKHYIGGAPEFVIRKLHDELAKPNTAFLIYKYWRFTDISLSMKSLISNLAEPLSDESCREAYKTLVESDLLP